MSIYRGHVPAPVPKHGIRRRYLAGPRGRVPEDYAARLAEAHRRAWRSGVRLGILIACVVLYLLLLTEAPP